MEKIDNLIDRLASPEPEDYREAEKVNDTTLLPHLRKLGLEAVATNRFLGVTKVISSIAINSGSEEASQLFTELVGQRCPRSDVEMMYLIELALDHKNPGILPLVDRWIRPILDAPHWLIGWLTGAIRGDEHFIDSLMYLGTFGDSSHLHRIGKCLMRDCNRRIDATMAVIALEETGSEEAIPYLEWAIERYLCCSVDGIEADPVKFSRRAIEAIREKNQAA